MIRELVPALALAGLLAPMAQGQEPTAQDPAEDAAQAAPLFSAELSALIAEHEATELGRKEGYAAFLPRFEALAKAQADNETGVRATLWMIQNTWWLRSEDTMESTAMPLAEDLLERHPRSPQLDLLVEYHYVFTKRQRKQIAEGLIEVSPHQKVKGAAHFGLARLQPARGKDGQPNPHYAILVQDFADVPWRETTYGQIANAYLNPFAPEDLEVGKAAPEIVGVDQDGQPLRLSDFRGRVVLLDFWGDW